MCVIVHNMYLFKLVKDVFSHKKNSDSGSYYLNNSSSHDIYKYVQLEHKQNLIIFYS